MRLADCPAEVRLHQLVQARRAPPAKSLMILCPFGHHCIAATHLYIHRETMHACHKPELAARAQTPRT